MMENSTLLAQRSSCNRCRSQELKCSVLATTDVTNAPRCERCTRANVPCVFGRRSQSKRQINAQRKDRVTNGTTSEGTKPAYPTQPGLDSEPLVMEFGSLDDNTEAITSLPGDQSWPRSEVDPFEHLDGSLFEQSPSCINHLFSGPECFYLGEVPASDAPPVPCLDDGEETQETCVASLIADIQHVLSNLEDSRWSSNGYQQNLDEYPVGAVLDLSRRFEATAQALLQAHSCIPYDSDKSGLKTAAGPLLVVAGGALLLKLIHLVLNHFQQYIRSCDGLSRGSSFLSNNNNNANANTIPSPVYGCSSDSERCHLKLNELPESVPGLGKIHKAVCLLEVEFNRAVKHLLVTGDGSCSLAQEAVSSASGLEDACCALNKQLRSVVGDLLSDRKC